MDMQSTAALLQLGELEFHARNYARSAEYLKRASELRPNDPQVAFQLGEALRLSGDLPGAEKALQASLKILPRQYAARFALGSVYFALQRWSAAQDQLEAALLTEPTFDAEIKLSEVLLKQRKFAEATQHVDAALQLRRDSPEAYELRLARRLASAPSTLLRKLGCTQHFCANDQTKNNLAVAS